MEAQCEAELGAGTQGSLTVDVNTQNKGGVFTLIKTKVMWCCAIGTGSTSNSLPSSEITVISSHGSVMEHLHCREKVQIQSLACPVERVH